MKTFALSAALALLALGCDDGFLDRTPSASLIEENFYQTSDDAVSAVNAIYAPLQLASFYNRDYPVLVEPPSDDVTLTNTQGTIFNTFAFSTAESQLSEVWESAYEGVFRANLVLQQLPEITMDEELKARLLGEARFLRALYYWHLTTLWGDVPFVTTADPDNPDAFKIAKSPQSEVYALMTSDLQAAVEALPLEYGGPDAGRATQGAAQALLGKVYLYDERYAEAQAVLQEVVESGVYDLVQSYGELFLEENENNAESVFELQYLDVGGNAWATEDGPNANESSVRPRLNLPNGFGGFGNHLPTEDLVSEFEEGDPRLGWAVWREGDTYDEGGARGEPEAYSAGWSLTGYNIKKGMVPIEPNDPSVGTNWPIIRFADVLLMYAEAANATGDQATAIEAINRVRARVGLDPLPDGLGQADVFEALVHERRVELAFEYHRYHDLRRWGLAEEELDGYDPAVHRYFPIPQSELDVNPELEQNEGY